MESSHSSDSSLSARALQDSDSHFATPPQSDPSSTSLLSNGRSRSDTLSSMPDTPALSEDSSPYQSQHDVEDGGQDDSQWSPVTQTDSFKEDDGLNGSFDKLNNYPVDGKVDGNSDVQDPSIFPSKQVVEESDPTEKDSTTFEESKESDLIEQGKVDSPKESVVKSEANTPSTLEVSSRALSPASLQQRTQARSLKSSGILASPSTLGGPSSSAFFPRSPNPTPVSPVTSTTHIITSQARSISIQSSGPPLRFFSAGDEGKKSEVDQENGIGTSLSPTTSTLTAEPLSWDTQPLGKGKYTSTTSSKLAEDVDVLQDASKRASSGTGLTLAHARSQSFFPQRNWNSTSSSSAKSTVLDEGFELSHEKEKESLLGLPTTPPLQKGDRPSSSFGFGGAYQTPTSSQLQHEATLNEIARSSLSLDPRLVEFCSSLNGLDTSSQLPELGLSSELSAQGELEKEIQSYTEKIRLLQLSQARLQGAQAERQRVATSFQSGSTSSSPISEISNSSNPLYGAAPELLSSQAFLLTAQQQYHLANLPQGEEREQALWNARNAGMEEGLDGLTSSSSSGGPSPNNRKLGLYKTERCRSWEEKGSCRYGQKCQFAHGKDELRHVNRHPKYKTEICRTFWRTGTCPYAKRCCFIHTTLDDSTSPTKDEPVERAPLLARVSAASKAQGNGFGSSSPSISSSGSFSNVAGSTPVGSSRDVFSSSSSGTGFNGSSSALVSASPSPSPIPRQQSYNSLGTSASIYAPQSPTSPATSFNSPENHGMWPSSLESFGGRSLQNSMQANERLHSGLGLQFSSPQSHLENSQRSNPKLSSIFDGPRMDGEARTVGFKPRPNGAHHQNSIPSRFEDPIGTTLSAFSSQEQLRTANHQSSGSLDQRFNSPPPNLSGFGFSPFQPYTPQESTSQTQTRPPGFFLPQQSVRGAPASHLEAPLGEDRAQQSRRRSFTLPSFVSPLPSSSEQGPSPWNRPQPYHPQISSPSQVEKRFSSQASQSSNLTDGSLWNTSTPVPRNSTAERPFFERDTNNQGSNSPKTRKDFDLIDEETFGEDEGEGGFFNNGMFLSSK